MTIDLDAIQAQRAKDQMRDSRCWRLRRRHEKDSWDVKKSQPIARPVPRERCIGCGRSRKGSHFASYCNPCGTRVRNTGTYEGPRDFLIWRIGPTGNIIDVVNREER
jgi:hypothetical protein